MTHIQMTHVKMISEIEKLFSILAGMETKKIKASNLNV